MASFSTATSASSSSVTDSGSDGPADIAGVEGPRRLRIPRARWQPPITLRRKVPTLLCAALCPPGAGLSAGEPRRDRPGTHPGRAPAARSSSRTELYTCSRRGPAPDRRQRASTRLPCVVLDVTGCMLHDVAAATGDRPVGGPSVRVRHSGFATVRGMAEPERTMQVIQVEERDSGWEDLDPRFRVYLHGSSATSTGGWTDTYDITGADVLRSSTGHNVRSASSSLMRWPWCATTKSRSESIPGSAVAWCGWSAWTEMTARTRGRQSEKSSGACSFAASDLSGSRRRIGPPKRYPTPTPTTPNSSRGHPLIGIMRAPVGRCRHACSLRSSGRGSGRYDQGRLADHG